MKCAKCLTDKDLSEFVKTKKAQHRTCRECRNAYFRVYSKQPEAKAKLALYASNRRDRNRKFLFSYLSDKACVDCGETDPVVLEFDHTSEEPKTNDISTLCHTGASLDRIRKEIEKCEVRCANCHKRKTAKQFNWWKSNC